ncbi:T-cell immunomodulatory protein [Sergentomyia squamirostris]
MDCLKGIVVLTGFLHVVSSLDFTRTVFGSATADGVPAAFGDFNSDELTDMFMLCDNFRTVKIFLGSDTEPLLKEGPKCTFKTLEIASVVPGDFDGDALMDVLMVVRSSQRNKFGIYINWGGISYMNCTDEEDKIVDVEGEPMVLDYNDDMVMDLFGLEPDLHKRTFWLFHKDRTKPDVLQMPMHYNDSLRLPHSHAFIDLNRDFTADLFLATERNFEVWNGTEKHNGFLFSHTVNLPTGLNEHVGQALFLDFELKGDINLVLPICFDRKCSNSTILVHNGHKFHDLQVNFKDPDNKQWGFVVPNDDNIFTNAITLRGGDFNMDGYPDLLATLQQNPGGEIQTFLLENVPADRKPLSRTFAVRWKALAPFANGTVAGAFYDFYQDGILDVVLVEKSGKQYKTKAFRNSLDYDANFVKVIVLTGLVNKEVPTTKTPLGRTKKTYGSNLPGPRIAYYTITQDGYPQYGTSAQIPQSAYFALHLPYTIFGLGRTPNFVDSITVGMSNQSRTWTQLIPNSQMIVVPWPIREPWRWKAQLFVTPSKLILMSMVALGGTCIVIMLIILGLYIKEKREDKIEKLQEAHRFHFDAM